MKRFQARYDPGVQLDSADVLALHRNENLFVGREWTVEAARALVERAGVGSYPDATSRPVREALAAHHGISPEQVFVGNGSDEVLADVLDLLHHRYQDLHVLDVCFKVYPLLAERIGYRMRTLPGDTFHSGRVQAEGFQGLALVDSPNAITGATLPLADLDALAADPASFLIHDNVYGEYAGDVLPPVQDNRVVVRSFSKFYALAGLRIGYCVGPEPLIRQLLDRKDAFNVNGFAQVMAVEALQQHDRFQAALEEMQRCRDGLVSALEGMGFHLHPAQGIALLARHPEHAGADLQQRLLDRGVAVRRFAEEPIQDHIRMTVPPRADLERLLDALRHVLGASPARGDA